MKKKCYATFDEYLQDQLRDPTVRSAFEDQKAKMEVSYALWEIRRKKKMTQKMLAKKLGTTQSAIARIEAGGQNVTIDLLGRIATLFGKKLILRFR